LTIDTLLQASALLVLGLIAFGIYTWGGASSTSWALAALLIVAFLVYYAYFGIFEVFWQGQTPGKRLVGLRVMAVPGRPISLYQPLIRILVRIADQIPGLYGVAIVSVSLSRRQQRLGDFAAATVVVHERPIDPEVTLSPSRAAPLATQPITR